MKTTQKEKLAKEKSFPPAPAVLSPFAKGLWDEIVKSFPPDWFRQSDFPLLIEHIYAVEMTRTLEKRLEKMKDTKDVALLNFVLRMRDRESRRAAVMATKLRIAPQSRSDKHMAGVKASKHLGGRDWESNNFATF